MNMADMIFGADIDDAPNHQTLTLGDLLRAPAKPKQRIRYGSKDYYRWIGKVSCVKAAAFIKKVMADEKKADCPCCGGTGEYVGANYRTRCARCKGKGFLTSQDEKAYATWKSSRDRGLPRVRSDFGAAYNFA